VRGKIGLGCIVYVKCVADKRRGRGGSGLLYGTWTLFVANMYGGRDNSKRLRQWVRVYGNHSHEMIRLSLGVNRGL